MDVDDPVVSEGNVYVSQSLTEHLYVFQYPNRPACYSRDQQNILKSRIKPVQNKVELEVSLPMDTGNYSNSKGESIATRIGCGVADLDYERGMMDKQVLTSKLVDMASNRYAIAVLKDGELHLVPLKRILQLRPDFGYLDKAVIGDQKMIKEREGTETEEEEEEARPVQVQIARVKSDKAEAAHKASYRYQQQQLQEEQWVELNCINLQERRADSERGCLFCSTDDTMDVQELSHTHFLDSVCPADPVGGMVGSLTQPTLKEQIRTVLLNAIVMTFGQVCMLLGNSVPSDQVLQCLGVMATLVRGCWVIKSDILYKDGTCSDVNGVSCEQLRLARDQLLLCFTKSRLVKRNQMPSIASLPKEEMLQILDGVSLWRPSQGWEFKLADDQHFISDHPTIVKQHMEQWRLLYSKSPAAITIPTKTDGAKSPVAGGSHDHSVTSNDGDNNLANQIEASPDHEQELSTILNKIIGRTVVKVTDLRQAAQSKSQSDISDKDFMKAMQVANIIELDCKWMTTDKQPSLSSRLCVCRQVGDNTDKYRLILVELLQNSKVVTYKELVNKAQELGEKPSRETLLKTLKDLCTHKSNRWIINYELT
ncbi:DNA-directed RNA polymerase III subunit RPC5-like [Dysidea avara]|uniref:DNA-directed RNA polymerase III subunit RPC5-like n=1 Tax=Dysidea avara TaxID=196820 RepID=UPI0033213CAB